MLGTIVNTAAVVGGSLIGLLLKGGLKPRFSEIMMKALALCVLYIGISGSLKTQNVLLLILSLVIGALLGEAADVDTRLTGLGNWIEGKLSKGGKQGSISEGFVTASLLYCIGSMAIIGSIQSGLEGNHSTLFVKSILDGVASIIYASTLGVGVMLSAISVFVYQGALTLGAGFLGGVLHEAQIADITGVGSVIIIALGLNLLGITKIKVANLLPAIFLPLVYHIVLAVVT